MVDSTGCRLFQSHSGRKAFTRCPQLRPFSRTNHYTGSFPLTGSVTRGYHQDRPANTIPVVAPIKAFQCICRREERSRSRCCEVCSCRRGSWPNNQLEIRIVNHAHSGLVSVYRKRGSVRQLRSGSRKTDMGGLPEGSHPSMDSLGKAIRNRASCARFFCILVEVTGVFPSHWRIPRRPTVPSPACVRPNQQEEPP